MGAVWRGTDELLNRTVAVKELLAAAEPPTAAGGDALEESRQRLMREGRIGARLQHPHVISMFDVVVHDDRPWLVMEYLPSRSLAGHARSRRDRSSRARPRRSGRQVADGLAAAHAAGVVHRDVKPGNVLIADDGRVKLTDFGVSRAVDDVQLTRTGLIAGTPAFLSPEVARGQEPTAGVGRVRARRHALRRRRGSAAVRARRQRLRPAAQGRHRRRRPAAAGRTADRAAHAAAVRRPDDRPTAAQARDALGGDRRGAAQRRRHRTAVLDGGAAAGIAPRSWAAPRSRDAAPEPVADRCGAAARTACTVRRGDAGDGAGDRSGPRSGAARCCCAPGGGAGRRAGVLGGGADHRRRQYGHVRHRPRPRAPRRRGRAGGADDERPGHHHVAAPTTDVTTTAPTTTSATTTTTGRRPRPTRAVAFVQSYYGLLPGNTDAAWALLSPTAQGPVGRPRRVPAVLRRHARVSGGERPRLERQHGDGDGRVRRRGRRQPAASPTASSSARRTAGRSSSRSAASDA